MSNILEEEEFTSDQSLELEDACAFFCASCSGLQYKDCQASSGLNFM